MTCSLGGVFAEEVLARTQVPKDTPPTELSESQLDEVYVALQNMLAHPIAAVRTADAVFPFKLQKIDSCKEQISFNKAIADFVLEKEEAKEQKDLASKTATSRNKFEKIVFAQQKNLESLEKKEKQFQAAGEAMYAKYQELSTLLYQFQEDAKKLTSEELKNKYTALSFVSSMSLKDKTITVEVPDVKN
jgi:predicted ribosome quality control (RQC) complex YloA/Tae2 family protein